MPRDPAPEMKPRAAGGGGRSRRLRRRRRAASGARLARALACWFLALLARAAARGGAPRLLAAAEGVQWRRDALLLRRGAALPLGARAAAVGGVEESMALALGGALPPGEAAARLAAGLGALRSVNTERPMRDGGGGARACAPGRRPARVAACVVGEARHVALTAPALAANLLVPLARAAGDAGSVNRGGDDRGDRDAGAGAPDAGFGGLNATLFLASYLTEDALELELIVRHAMGEAMHSRSGSNVNCSSGGVRGMAAEATAEGFSPKSTFTVNLGGVWLPLQSDAGALPTHGAAAHAAARRVILGAHNRNLGAGGLSGVLAYLRLHDACAGMIEAYEARAGVPFDAIIRTRTDGLWTAPAEGLPQVSVLAATSKHFYTIGDFEWGGLNDRFSLAGRKAGLRMLRRTEVLMRVAGAAARLNLTAQAQSDRKALRNAVLDREQRLDDAAGRELPPDNAQRAIQRRRSRLRRGGRPAAGLLASVNSEKLTLAAAALWANEVEPRELHCARWPGGCQAPYCVLASRRAALGFHDQLGTPLAVMSSKCEPCNHTAAGVNNLGVCPLPARGERSATVQGWQRGWEALFKQAMGPRLSQGLSDRAALMASPHECVRRWQALLRAARPLVTPADLRARDVCALSGHFGNLRDLVADVNAGAVPQDAAVLAQHERQLRRRVEGLLRVAPRGKAPRAMRLFGAGEVYGPSADTTLTH